jgi:hypothetical protein
MRVLLNCMTRPAFDLKFFDSCAIYPSINLFLILSSSKFINTAASRLFVVLLLQLCNSRCEIVFCPF